MNNAALALFDFCGTIVGFQTADAYVFYVCSHTSNPHTQQHFKVYRFMKYSGILSLLGAADKFLRRSLKKKALLNVLRGMPYEELDRLAQGYYEECIRPGFIMPVLKEMERFKNEGSLVYLVSGGYDIYLKYFMHEYHLDGCISTRILFQNGVCMGKFIGADCMGKQKVMELERHFGEAGRKGSHAYSDSRSDLPMLEWAEKGTVVSPKGSQPWAVENHLEEMLWEN